MKSFVLTALGASLLLANGTAPAQKIIGPDKPQAVVPISVAKAPAAGQGLTATLARAGKFGTFLALMKTAGIQDDSVRGVTLLAPNDAAFAAMDKAKLESLRKDPAAAKAFVMAHVVGQPLKVQDMFHTNNPTSVKLFKSAGGDELKLLCNGMPHVGLHHPVINGTAKVADLQDLHFNGGIIQEIDGVLAR